MLPPPAAGEQQGEEQRGKAWRAEVAAEWGKGDVTVGKVEVSRSPSLFPLSRALRAHWAVEYDGLYSERRK